MGVVGHLSPDGAGDKVVVGFQNQDVQNDEKVGKDGVVREFQGLSEEEESKMNDIVQDLNKEDGGDVVPLGQGVGAQKHQQQQVPGSIICWDRFLPVRTLKVLLVESDDSTRQVVSALLRNCSYEVTATANGLEAWKILEDLTNHTDLILTEVVMPCLSGIGLLNKIMNHKTRKNIPVIMMSSNDSMGTVFKCLSKGAVDFLVKPIRKNELKNLWQHVWRRCHSSSGSGSESGIQTQKSVKSKSIDDSDNNSGSNDDDDNGSTPLHARDGSDDGSGTQSSWTKRAVEIESPQRVSPDQFADPPDSTCAQVIHPRPEASCNDWMAMSGNEDSAEHKEPADDLMGKDLEIGVARHTNVEFETHTGEKTCSKVANANMEKLLGSDKKIDSALGLECKNVLNEQRTPAADLIGAIECISDLQSAARIIQAPNGYSRTPEGKEKAADGSADLPSLELSLKRLRSISYGGTATTDDRNVLRRSEQSAFSRYHTSAASNQAPTGHGGSSPLDNSSEAIRPESIYNTVFSSSADPINQGSNGSSNNNEMGSTAKNIFAKSTTHKEKITSPSTVKFSQTSSAFHPVQLRVSTNQQVEKIEEKTWTAVKDASGSQHQVEVQHHHHHFHHHHVHVHNLQNQQEEQEPMTDNVDVSLKNVAGAAPQCGSSNAFSAPVEGNASNYGSNSGSNHGSNGHNGRSAAAMKSGGTNVESASGLADRSGAGGGNGSGSGSASGVDQHRFAQREAALQKFRQKRKERNFGKKVRYQSRKRLAEQRPRVRGQFVRQNMQDQTGVTGRENDKSAS